jgi:hypothetical protein
MNGQLPELQQRLMDANLGLAESDFGYHATDLYVLAKPGVREWLKKNYEFYSNVMGFRSNPECNWKGAVALDIPFAGYWPKARV